MKHESGGGPKTKAAKWVVFISFVHNGYCGYNCKTLEVLFYTNSWHCIKILDVYGLRITRYDHEYNWGFKVIIG
jgi:hypothetical protein